MSSNRFIKYLTYILFLSNIIAWTAFLQANTFNNEIELLKEKHKSLSSCNSVITNRLVEAKEILEAIQSNKNFCAYGITIRGALDLSELVVLSSNDSIKSYICIIKSKFLNDFEISSKINKLFFENMLIFEESEFLGTVDIRSVIFNQRVDFKSCKFNEEVNLFDSEFRTIVEFDWSEFKNGFICQLSKFKTLDFDGAIFEDNFLFQINSSESISLTICRFKKSVLFTDNYFENTADFREIRIDGDFIFSESKSSYPHNHQNKTFYDFGGSIFQSRVIFSKSNLDSVSFYHKKLPTLFLESVDFSNVQFGSVKFENIFFDNVDFSESQFYYHVDMNNLSFSSLNIRWRQLRNAKLNGISLEKPNEIINVLSDSSIKDLITFSQLLETNFRKLNYLKDANKLYYLYNFLQGSQKSGIAKFLDRVVLWAILGYLVQPLRILIWSLFLVLIFAIIYFVSKNSLRFINKKDKGKDNHYIDSLLKGPPLEKSKQHTIIVNDRNIRKANYAFLLSFSIFFKFPTTSIIIQADVKIIRFFAWLEWFAGMIILPLFLISLSRTVPIIHDLIDKFISF